MDKLHVKKQVASKKKKQTSENKIRVYKVLFLTVLRSIIVNRIFKINTRVNEMIFGKV